MGLVSSPLKLVISTALSAIWLYCPTHGNKAPEFIPEDDTVVLQVKEGYHTPVGSVVHQFSGKDWDGDTLTFFLIEEASDSKQEGDFFTLERTSKTEADLVLVRLLDREKTPEIILEVFLTDSMTMTPNSQKIYVIVGDTNDNFPLFQPCNKTFTIPEDSAVPRLIATYHATDVDEGPNGEVRYSMRGSSHFELYVDDDDGDISDPKAELWLTVPLDYSKDHKHELHIVAYDNPVTWEEIRKEAAISVTINVFDTRDLPPIFLNIKTRATEILETVPVGSPVVSVHAEDGNPRINNPIYYEILNYNDQFSIEPTTGLISTKFNFLLDRIYAQDYRVLVRATELTHSRNFTASQNRSNDTAVLLKGEERETEVVINVTEIRDRPHFKSTSLMGHLPENSSPGSLVTLKAGSVAQVYDYDKMYRDLITLTVEGDDNTFEVQPEQGYRLVVFNIVVKNPDRLDYEKLKAIDFLVVATDSDGNRTSLPVSVTITNVNDNGPVFAKRRYFAHISENPPPGMLLATVQAHDADEGLLYGQQSVRYVRLLGLAAQELALNETSGRITVAAVKNEAQSIFDRERHPTIYTTIEVRDNFGEGTADLTVLVIQLKDKNDNRPQFSQPMYETEIFENQPSMSLNLGIFAVDADQPGSDNSKILYSLKVGANNTGKDILRSILDIDPQTGTLFLKRTLDFEEISKIILPWPSSDSNAPLKIPLRYILQASDLGKPPQVVQVPLTIFLWDTNDYTPEFNPSVYNITLREDVQSPLDIVKLTAQDKDASPGFNSINYVLSYRRMLGVPQDMFGIDATSGVISLKAGHQFDYNRRQQYTLYVECSDELTLKADAIVHVTVLEVNDKPPTFLQRSNNTSKICSWYDFPSWTTCSEYNCYTGNITENSPAGVKIAQVEALDPDSNAELRYRIDSYGVGINGEIVDDLAEYITIEPVSGVVSSGSEAFDYEMITSLRITVVVEDTKGEVNIPQVTRAWLVVNILNVNDVPPIFLRSEYTADLVENSPVGTEVVGVTAVVDAEGEDIFYSLQEGEVLPEYYLPFEVDQRKGVIRVVGLIDREDREWYNFSVEAKTRMYGANNDFLQAVVPVWVKILDVNDNWPVFTDAPANFSVKENSPVGTLIGRVHAEDKDQKSFGIVTYLLDEESSLRKFSIDSSSGEIYLTGAIDREEKDSYEVNVTAIDNFNVLCRNLVIKNNSNSVIKMIHVSIEDINDNTPQFHFFPGELNETRREKSCSTWDTLAEEQPVFSFFVTDDDQKGTPNAATTAEVLPDLDEDATTIFKVLERSPSLSEGYQTWGLVRARSLVGYDGNQTVTLQVQDEGTPRHSSTEEISIEIKSDNPVYNTLCFAKTEYKGLLTRGYPPNSTILEVLLSVFPKEELSPNITFKLKLVNKKDPFSQDAYYQAIRLFSIDPKSGLVSNSVPVNNETYPNSSYTFHVSVRWSPIPDVIRWKAVLVTVYLINPSQKLRLFSRFPWKGAKDSSQKAYQLVEELEHLFGVIVYIESVPIIVTGHITPNVLFLVNMHCPETYQFLEHFELLKLFQYSVRELETIFQQFQIVHSPFESLNDGSILSFSDILMGPNRYEKLCKYLSIIWTSNNQNFESIYRDAIHFENATEFYLYFTLFIVWLLALVIILFVAMRMVEDFVSFVINVIRGDNLTDVLDVTALYVVEGVQLPVNVAGGFGFNLDLEESSSDDEFVDTWSLAPDDETDC